MTRSKSSASGAVASSSPAGPAQGPAQPPQAGEAEDSPKPSLTLADIQHSIKSSSDTVCQKLDQLTAEVAGIKHQISELETSVSMNSDKILDIEQKQIPDLQKKLEKDVAELKDQLLAAEIYNRRSNLLFYGVQESTDENIYTVLKNVFRHLGLEEREAVEIALVNAHRLPHPRHIRDQDQGLERGQTGSAVGAKPPRAIIAKFVYMRQRDLVLTAFEDGLRQKTKTKTWSSVVQPSRNITVRTDLPPALKARRGVLGRKAYDLRREGKSTKIALAGTKVLLKWKEKGGRIWNTYIDWVSRWMELHVNYL